ncbi:30S ribosomal protein S8 [Waddlia chondrophila]|uniref:Small ribosomal subunit protein uS8 n=2 Tax=Waddlia chondrophila TaxID=71667 RepID=D6YRZ3_WADCW|nr:30S ribosomal protein S8 [Waddlia chondrophila]ADI38838.1 30S ribosomal protein S8 [Waddlia chondrophila WSU 86-1044]
MAVTDPVADFLTRIRNGLKAQHRYVDINWSKMKQSLADILKNEGFIENYLVKKDNNDRGTIRVFLRYGAYRQPAIKGLKRLSRPGLRKYVKHNEIPKFYGGLGVSILSTSSGILSGNEAQNKKVGGELLCLIW